MKRFKKIISLLICAMLLLAMIPTASLAVQAEETITVYFTDNAGFGTPNIYYWPNGGAWPGSAMTFSEQNSFGENVYKATVPADVTGIIFNGVSGQTVDITTGIANNAQWYTAGQQDGKWAVEATVHEGGEPATEAPQPATQAPENITVYYTDTLNWYDVKVYYWYDNGTDNGWPGVSMTECGLDNDNHMVYSAVIPCDVDGLYFDIGSSYFMTVDITEGIADGAHWYATGETDGPKYVVALVGNTEPTSAPETQAQQPATQAAEFPYHFTVDVSEINTSDFPAGYWFAWTWDDGGSGEWISIGRFNEVDSKKNILFVKTSTNEPSWNTCVLQTVDFVVQDGGSLKLLNQKDGSNNYMGAWVAEPTSAPETQAQQPATQAAEFPYHFTVDVSEINTSDFPAGYWFAWTWDDGGSGEWISIGRFNEVDSKKNILFVKTSTNEPSWNACVLQTVDFVVQDGGSLKLLNQKDSSNNYMGAWVAEPTSAPATEAPQPTTDTPDYSDGPVILSQPFDWANTDGVKVFTCVGAAGNGPLTYQWYYWKADKNKWIAAQDYDDTYDSIVMAPKFDGRQVFCRITDANGKSVDSEVATLTSLGPQAEPVAITLQPQNWYGFDGDTVNITIVAAGDGLTYKWYYLNSKGKWVLSGDDDAFYNSVTMKPSIEGRQVYCVVSDCYGYSVKSNTVTVNYSPGLDTSDGPVIVSQPSDWANTDGVRVFAFVAASGEGTLSYQWYYWKAEKNKWVASDDKDDAYDSIIMEPKFNGRRVFCRVTDALGRSVDSNVVTLTSLSSQSDPIVITRQPQSWSGPNGSQVVISVEAEGTGLTYQWYYWKAEKNKWVAASDTDSSYDMLVMEPKFNGRRVYCKITDEADNTVSTNEATITLSAD